MMEAGDSVMTKDGRQGIVSGFRYPVRAWKDGEKLKMERLTDGPIVGIQFGEDPALVEWIPWEEIVKPKSNGTRLFILIAAVSALALVALASYIVTVLS